MGGDNREKPGNEVAHVNEFAEGQGTPPARAGYSWEFNNNNNKFIQYYHFVQVLSMKITVNS